MTDEELIERTRMELERRGFSFGEFWQIMRSSSLNFIVWFWGIPRGDPNYSCTFDEEGKLLWCNV